MGDETRRILDKIEPDRRRFVQRILAVAGFAVPSVRSYLLAQLPGSSPAAPTTGNPTPPPTTTLPQTTTTLPQTTTTLPQTTTTLPQTTTTLPQTTTTLPQTTSVPQTTTPSPTTTAAFDENFFLQWFFNADGR